MPRNEEDRGDVCAELERAMFLLEFCCSEIRDVLATAPLRGFRCPASASKPEFEATRRARSREWAFQSRSRDRCRALARVGYIHVIGGTGHRLVSQLRPSHAPLPPSILASFFKQVAMLGRRSDGLRPTTQPNMVCYQAMAHYHCSSVKTLLVLT